MGQLRRCHPIQLRHHRRLHVLPTKNEDFERINVSQRNTHLSHWVLIILLRMARVTRMRAMQIDSVVLFRLPNLRMLVDGLWYFVVLTASNFVNLLFNRLTSLSDTVQQVRNVPGLPRLY